VKQSVAITLLSIWMLALTQAARPATDSTDIRSRQLQDAIREYRAALDAHERDERLARFRAAENFFQRLIAGDDDHSGVRNPDLYVNLGNAALGAERLGAAILAYQRALHIDPQHARAQQNLRHARSLLPDWVPRPREHNWVDSLLAGAPLAPRRFSIALAVEFLAAALCFAIALRWRIGWLRSVAVLLAIAWTLGGLWYLYTNTGPTYEKAVVIADDLLARSADSPRAPARFPQPVPTGTEVELIEIREDWAHVRFADSRDGWLPRGALETIDSGNHRNL
jgi:tetratricopeptide (TPR) repeat protein